MTEIDQEKCIARLQVRVEGLEKRMVKVEEEIKDLLRFMAEINMLMKLSLGGGALTIINLIMVLLDKVN